MRLIFTIIVLSFIGYILQLITGILIFLEKYTLSPDKITDYVLQKSKIGLLEIIFPHLIFIPAFSFVLLHFLYFIPISKRIIIFSTIIFLSGLLETLSTFFIFLYGSSFSYIKLSAFIFYELGIFTVIFFIIFSFRKYHRF